LKLLDFLTRERIVPDLLSAEKGGVLEELAAALAADGSALDIPTVVSVLTDRERLGSTGIGEGVAIPHGKLEGLDSVVAAFGRSRGGVDFESLDGAPVHLIFLLLSPAASASTHLMALARISRLLKNRSFRDELLRAKGRDEIFEAISAEDSKA
jgi:PTS system nitrogen regulatory IIA component